MIKYLKLKNIKNQEDVDIDFKCWKGNIFDIPFKERESIFNGLIFVKEILIETYPEPESVIYESGYSDQMHINSLLSFGIITGNGKYDYVLTWNKRKIISEKIVKNGKVYIERSDLLEDDIPFFGPAWEDDDEMVDQILETYEICQKGLIDSHNNYLMSITTGGQEIKMYLRKHLFVARVDDLLRKCNGKWSKLTVIHVINLLRQEFPLLFNYEIDWFYSIYNNYFPNLGFSNVEIKNGRIYIMKGGEYYHDNIYEMGTGFSRLCFIIPLYHQTIKEEENILFIPDMEINLHYLLRKSMLKTWKENGKGQLLRVNEEII